MLNILCRCFISMFSGSKVQVQGLPGDAGWLPSEGKGVELLLSAAQKQGEALPRHSDEASQEAPIRVWGRMDDDGPRHIHS